MGYTIPSSLIKRTRRHIATHLPPLHGCMLRFPGGWQYVPPRPLSDFVTSFRLYEGYNESHVRERVLPTGTTELVINLREDVTHIFKREGEVPRYQLTGALVCGVHSECFVIDATQKVAVLTTNFKPSGAFPFFGLPASELYNEIVSLDTLWGSIARDLRDQLLEADTPALKFWLLEHYLLERLLQSDGRHPAVSFALQALSRQAGKPSIAEITAEIGLSARYFKYIFQKEVGLTPKLFARVQRLQEVIQHIKDAQAVNWMDIALACGYYDQAHFIHDFRAFSGFTPSNYLTWLGSDPNHIPLS